MTPLRILLAVGALFLAPLSAHAAAWTWDPTNWFGSGITLSNGNTTANRSYTGTGNLPIKTNESVSSGTVTEYATFDSHGGDGDAGFAFLNASAVSNNFGWGSDVNSIAIYGNGEVDFNNANVGFLLPGGVAVPTTGARKVGIQVDIAAKTIRFNLNDGSWGSPYDITSLINVGGPFKFGFVGYNPGNQMSLVDPAGGGGGTEPPHGRLLKGCC